ncbi:MAG: hypothetical protein KatS3mg060_1865 [Dehalococcoidia bacterium]|jgi:hypothetical protein|nr:MAG: hypothetical protein KatS3mg060_1865 [Dehalococcoidia bacterium]
MAAQFSAPTPFALVVQPSGSAEVGAAWLVAGAIVRLPQGGHPPVGTVLRQKELADQRVSEGSIATDEKSPGLHLGGLYRHGVLLSPAEGGAGSLARQARLRSSARSGDGKRG